MLNSVTTARLTLHLPSEKVSFASKDSCQPYILPQITLPSIKVSIYQWITSLLPFTCGTLLSHWLIIIFGFV